MIYLQGIQLTIYEVSSNTTVFVDLTSSCSTLSGRLVRGSDIDFDGGAHNLGTWAEMNWQSYPLVYGGVSVIEGDIPHKQSIEEPNTTQAMTGRSSSNRKTSTLLPWASLKILYLEPQTNAE
jgi:hypothetical protein